MLLKALYLIVWFVYVQHLYVSLAELQVAREEEITRNPLSKVDSYVDMFLLQYDMICKD